MTDAFIELSLPEYKKRAVALSELLESEDGVTGGMTEFHKQLPLSEMVCDVSGQWTASASGLQLRKPAAVQPEEDSSEGEEPEQKAVARREQTSPHDLLNLVCPERALKPRPSKTILCADKTIV